MSAAAPADAVTHLPGLAPCAASLLVLVRAPSIPWEQVRYDPGLLLLLAKNVRGPWSGVRGPLPIATVATDQGPRTTDNCRTPDLFDEAVRLVDRAPFVNWGERSVSAVYQASLACARLAESIAERTGSCDPSSAWVAAMLAPLGWFGICAISTEHARECLNDPHFNQNPAAVQRRHWGSDQAAIARRLNRRWQLPAWLGAVTGHLDLPADDARALGADPHLFRIVQLAVGLVQKDGGGLQLAVGGSTAENSAALGITADDWVELETLADTPAVVGAIPFAWEAPAGKPLLRDLLILAGENRRLADGPGWHDLECEVDHLHRALREQRSAEDKRLRDQKLAALAEFAAGAGHEINNPLAVISGQAQYLLGDEADSSRQRSLQTIINQTHRIYQILNALMQFARPARPQKHPVDLLLLIRDLTAELSDLAEERRVRLSCTLPDHPVETNADTRQLRLALECLLRNAIEAAPPEGWAGIRLETPSPDRIELVVEDSGDGPTEAQREHMFDPFYSGRQAGRGRGLGLPTAWRLAREHGGDVRFENLSQGPTRFVLTLPRQPETMPASGQRCA